MVGMDRVPDKERRKQRRNLAKQDRTKKRWPDNWPPYTVDDIQDV